MNVATQETPTSPEERRRTQARARRLSRRAETLASAGRFAEAIDCQAEVAELRPRDPVAFFRLGLLYREARRMDSAVSALRQAAELDPDHRDPREALIGTLLEAGRYDETVAEGRALVKVAPRSLFARDALSVAYLQLGKIGQAVSMVGEMVRLDPTNPAHHLKRAMLEQQNGHLGEAVRAYVRAAEMAEPESEPYEEAVSALESLDDFQMRQIVLLATEDKTFGLKLRQDAGEAVRERGFHLSPDGLARLRHLAHAHLSELAPDYTPTATWGGVRYYN